MSNVIDVSFSEREFGFNVQFSDMGKEGPQGPAGVAGPKGDKGDKGDRGEPGEKGDAFRFSDFTVEQLESLRGPQGYPGAAGAAGADGKTPVKGTDYWTAEDRQQMVEDVQAAWVTRYEGTAMGEKCAGFSALMNGTDKVESFVFFTDPHLAQGEGYEPQLQTYLETIRNYYRGIPASFVVCGGDWIGNSDTRSEACFKLGYIDRLVRGQFDRFYPVVGNHDTNYQGVDVEGGQAYSGTLSNETVRNLLMREEDKLYYAFDGAHTRFYVLDTGSDWVEDMTDYRWEQIAWLAQCLKTDDAACSALVLHIGYDGNGTQPPFSAHVTALCGAYNNRTAITLNGTDYDFSGCSGLVKFALCGHIHADRVLVANGIPMVATTDTRAGGTASFDMCLVDYKGGVLHMVRVGSGSDRTVTLATGNDRDEEETLEESIVLILGMNTTGSCFHNNVTFRSLYLQRTAPDGVTKAMGWSSASTGEYPYDQQYYPIAIPEGAKQVVVTCPDTVKWGVHTWTVDAWNTDQYQTESDWLEVGGGAYELPEGAQLMRIVFHDNTGSDMSAPGYDTGAFSLRFSQDSAPPENSGDGTEGVYTVGEQFVFLSQCNHQGGSSITFERPTRALIVSTVSEQGAQAYGTTGGTGSAAYYPMAVPAGKTAITVHAPGLQAAVEHVGATGASWSSSGWLESDTPYTITSTSGFFILKLRNPDDAAFAADYDASGITWKFT